VYEAASGCHLSMELWACYTVAISSRFFLFKKKIKLLNTLSIYFIQTLRLIYNSKEIYLVLWLCIFLNYIYPITKRRKDTYLDIWGMPLPQARC
jgi:hypothetical protein